jgi:hypothetical protein
VKVEWIYLILEIDRWQAIVSMLMMLWGTSVWSGRLLGDTQTHLSGFLLFETWGCQRNKSEGALDLYYNDRALITWTLVKGHKGPVKGLRASGPQGPDHYLFILIPTVKEAGWAPRPVWTGAENLAPTGFRSPDRPARSESLYRLR